MVISDVELCVPRSLPLSFPLSFSLSPPPSSSLLFSPPFSPPPLAFPFSFSLSIMSGCVLGICSYLLQEEASFEQDTNLEYRRMCNQEPFHCYPIPQLKTGHRPKQRILHSVKSYGWGTLKCLISLAIREMQFKTTLRFHFLPVRMSKINIASSCCGTRETLLS